MKSKGSSEEKNISRRGFLAGAASAGIAAASAGSSGILSTAHAGKPPFPWGYKKIDPERAGEIAYESWYKNFCCFGAASGILRPLQEDIGEPYTLFPLEATVWGHGGAAGWGSLCGSLNGAGMATALIAGTEGEHIINDVITWYTKTKLPLYKPSRPRARVTQINISKSPLCHISVGKWMRKEGVVFESPQRWERCARITADVAMKTVQLLNDWVDGKYVITRRDQVRMYHMPTENRCEKCHGSNVPGVPE